MPGSTLTQSEGDANSHALPLYKIEGSIPQFSYPFSANSLHLGRLSDNRKDCAGPTNQLPRHGLPVHYEDCRLNKLLSKGLLK